MTLLLPPLFASLIDRCTPLRDRTRQLGSHRLTQRSSSTFFEETISLFVKNTRSFACVYRK